MSNRKARVVRSGEITDRTGLGSTALPAPKKPVCDIESWLPSYAPQGPSWRSTPANRRTLADWEKVSGFVRATIVRYVQVHGSVSVKSAQVLTRTVAELALFAAEQGTTVSTSAVLNHRTVQQFDEALSAALRARLKNLSSADRERAESAGRVTIATQVGRVRKVAQTVNPRGDWPKASQRRPRYITPPYTPDQVALLEDQIARNSRLARRNGEAFLVLGLGAGLDGRWVTKVRDEHVEDHGDEGLVVNVPGRAIPVLRAYEERLRALLADTPEGGLVYGGKAVHKNAAGEAVARIRLDPRGPQLDLGRLRATWLVTHLTAGTRVPELMVAAGVESMTAISDMAEFVPPLDSRPARCAVAVREMLRGPNGVTR